MACLLEWMDEDEYGFCYNLEKHLVKILDKANLAAFVNQIRARFDAAAKTTPKSDGSSKDRPDYVRRHFGEILRSLHAAQKDVAAYVALAEETGLQAQVPMARELGMNPAKLGKLDDHRPDTVSRLLDDVAERSTKVCDRGLARLVECADAALAALIANDTRTRKHCMRAGERHLVVPSSSEAAFKRTLREVGYLVSSGETKVTKARRAAAPESAAPQATEA